MNELLIVEVRLSIVTVGPATPVLAVRIADLVWATPRETTPPGRIGDGQRRRLRQLPRLTGSVTQPQKVRDACRLCIPAAHTVCKAGL